MSLTNRNVLDPTHEGARAGRVRYAPRGATFGPALTTNVWETKYAVRQEIQPVDAAPRPNHCAYVISAVPGDSQYFVEIGVVDQAPIVAMEEPAAGIEIHVVEAAAAPQIILAAEESAATSTTGPVVTNTDASNPAHLRWMPLDAG